MLEGNSGAYVPPEGGDSVWLVGDRITVKLTSEDTIPASAGSCVYAPRGTLHTFKNVGTSLSRVLAVISPGGFEKFFLEAGKPATEGSSPPEGEPDVRRIVEIGQKYGMEIPPPPPEQ